MFLVLEAFPQARYQFDEPVWLHFKDKNHYAVFLKISFYFLWELSGSVSWYLTFPNSWPLFIFENTLMLPDSSWPSPTPPNYMVDDDHVMFV